MLHIFPKNIKQKYARSESFIDHPQNNGQNIVHNNIQNNVQNNPQNIVPNNAPFEIQNVENVHVVHNIGPNKNRFAQFEQRFDRLERSIQALGGRNLNNEAGEEEKYEGE